MWYQYPRPQQLPQNNYRTTEEIRKYAFALLKGIAFDDLDEEYDDGKACESLTHGELPETVNFKSGTEEFEFIAAELKKLIASGVSQKDICIVARTHRLLDDYIALLTRAGIKTYKIKRNKLDDRSFEGVRVASMHRVKGLEFQYMFVAAVNKRVLPLESAINYTDSIAKTESVTAEKCYLRGFDTRTESSVYQQLWRAFAVLKN